MTITIASFSILCCKNKKDEQPISSTIDTYLNYFNDKERMDKLIKKIKEKGDTLAYNELKQIYSLSGHKEDYLHISLYMSNRYNYKQAYYDVYKNLSVLNKAIKKHAKDSINNQLFLDTETEELRIKYLKKAALRGHTKSISILNNLKSKSPDLEE